MRILVVFILFIALLAQTYSRFSVYLGFELNKNYLIQNRCENRAKPKSCCKASCVLTKELQKSDNQENSPKSSNKSEKFETIYFSSSSTFFITPHALLIQKSFMPKTVTEIPNGIAFSVFHPPKA